MPKIECWDNLPEGVRQHLIDRMRDRAISIADLNQLRAWIESKPEVPERDWYKGLRFIQGLWPRFVPQDVPAPWPGGQRRVTLRW